MSILWNEDLAAIDWSELSALYRIAPLGNKAPADLALVFGNSMFRAFASDAGRLVGAAARWPMAATAPTSVMLPCTRIYQGQGLGREIIERLLGRCRAHRRIILYAVPGKEGFCERLGFRRMTTAMAVFEDQASARRRGYLTSP